MTTPENPQTTSNPDREAGGCCGPSPCSAILADTPITDALRAEHRGPWEEVGEELCRAMIRHANNMERENARLRELVKEVTDWHKTPDSGEYNECDVAPCHWCEMANDILSKREPKDTWFSRTLPMGDVCPDCGLMVDDAPGPLPEGEGTVTFGGGFLGSTPIRKMMPNTVWNLVLVDPKGRQVRLPETQGYDYKPIKWVRYYEEKYKCTVFIEEVTTSVVRFSNTTPETLHP